MLSTRSFEGVKVFGIKPRLLYAGAMAVQEPSNRLVWVDLEMTGLDPETCTIVEIATLITDSELDVVAEGPCLVIHQSEEVLSRMNDFVRNMHEKSGLLGRIRDSRTSLADAEAQTLAFLTPHLVKGGSPLCGNSVWQDRAFLARYMPNVVDLLHYRIVDVSSIKELVRRWYPPEYQVPKKKEVHRALDDILESLAELRWYRQKLFLPPSAK